MLWNTPLAAAPSSTGFHGLTSPTLGNVALTGLGAHSLQRLPTSVTDFYEKPSWMGGLNVAGDALGTLGLLGPAISVSNSLFNTAVRVDNRVQQGFTKLEDFAHASRRNPTVQAAIDHTKGIGKTIQTGKYDRYARHGTDKSKALIKEQQN